MLRGHECRPHLPEPLRTLVGGSRTARPDPSTPKLDNASSSESKIGIALRITPSGVSGATHTFCGECPKILRDNEPQSPSHAFHVAQGDNQCADSTRGPDRRGRASERDGRDPWRQGARTAETM